MIKRLTLIFFLLAFAANVFSEEVKPSEASGGTLKGFVFDTKADQPLEYATISMISMREGKAVNGTITDATGFFKLKNVRFGMYKVKISFLGYEPKIVDKVRITPKNTEVDLGRIELTPSSENIEEAVVVADRPTLTYKIDKKVINVSQQHTSASGTAVEILENIPSVTVDIEGNVSLRGSSSFTVLIDSKPTVLDPSDALSQIPASAIENIEVITNPSAKYDPEGTSGIINIITKKNKLQGVTGVVNVNLGTQERYGGDFLFNWRKERINVFVGADFNNSNRTGNIDVENRRIDDTTLYILSNGEFERGRTTTGVRGGFDLTLNPRNSLNFEARVGDWSMNGGSTTKYNQYTIPATTVVNSNSFEDSERGGMYYNFSLGYTKKFMRKGHQIYALINYNGRDFDEESKTESFDNITGLQIDGKESLETGPRSSYKFQIDYTLPFSNSNKFEAGVQGSLSGYDEKASMDQYNPITLAYENAPEYSNDVTRKKNIYSAYSIYSGELGKFGYQAGLRGEYTYRDINLNSGDESFTIDRFDLFPTVHLSYNTENKNQWMVNYSRRIRRPRGYYLEPFITYMDAYNVRQGNPGLKPQYIDSYELSHLIKFGRNSFSIDAYYRMTDNKIERIRTSYDQGLFLNTYKNVGNDYALGIELMLGVDIQKWWHVDLMGNIYDYRVEGEYTYEKSDTSYTIDFSEGSFNWNTRLNNTFRIGKTTRIQLNAMYNSPSVSAQGDRDGFLMANLAVRQSFMKNKLAATLQIRDLFKTMSHSATITGDDIYSNYEYSPDWPMISMTLTYRINNYKPDRKKRSQDGNDDMGGDEVF